MSKQNMVVEITADDLKNADNYGSHTDCVFATALKRSFPNEQIQAYASDVMIGKQQYKLTNEDSYAIHAAYKTKVDTRTECLGVDQITPNSQLYEHKRGFPFTVTLELEK
jgi:hypothetical protein